jgi:hypothetical protein
VGQVAEDFNLTEMAVRVTYAERAAENCKDGGLVGAERQELAELQRKPPTP